MQPPILPMCTPAWLETAVFYEIYPQSYFDSNGDGIGDLPGIVEKLTYLHSLGVNALWLNPCFESPFYDAGYDVSDYYRVAPRYGTNDDLRRLFDQARALGIRVLLDLVPGHTSIEHAWFRESAQHQVNAYTDWYIWTDSAWTWSAPGLSVVSGFGERNGNFITNFFYHQPALNYGFANPDPSMAWQQPVDAPGPRMVREEIRRVMRFWLEMGASGFRVDMAGTLVKHDPGHRATIALWQEMRAWLDREFPEACLVSEWSNPALAIEAGFHMDFLLPFGTPGYTALLRKPYGPGSAHDPYGFSFFDRSGNGNIREFLDDYLRHARLVDGRGLIAFPTGNHDINPRLAIGRGPDDLALIYLMLMTFPGVPFIYYGDEIGMRTLDGLPSKEGGYERTGSRTPMQWDSGPNAGFSSTSSERLYLPVDPAPGRVSVVSQDGEPGSLLNRVRELIALRKAHPALGASAAFEVVFAEPGLCPFVYLRSGAGERVLVAINPASQPVQVELPVGLIHGEPKVLWGQAGGLMRANGGWSLSLEGVSGLAAQV